MPERPRPLAANARHGGNLRRSVRLTYANALVWALGNGLVSTTLVVYLGLELGAGGVAIAWLVAAPRIAGVLRLGAPALIAQSSRAGLGRKAVCLIAYAASCVALALVPLAAVATGGANDDSRSAAWGLGLLAACWCVYHVLEYVATVALWSWIGDLYPRSLRSRLLGVRERWLTFGRLVGIGVSVTLAFAWGHALPNGSRWAPLAASAAVGALLMLAALVPLVMTPALAGRPSATPEAPWRTLRRALAQRPYRRLLAYSCWFGLANGLTASAQAMYPGRVLGIDYAAMQLHRAGMWGGQSAIAPWCGRAVAAWGARRVMLPAQLIVATGPLWFWLATPERPWWIAVAFAAWIAYAALNVGLDTLKLNLADPANNAPYLAVYHGISDLVNASTVLLGGLLYDTLAAGDEHAMRVYAGLFLVGWVGRTLAAGLVMRLIEPQTPPNDRPPR